MTSIYVHSHIDKQIPCENICTLSMFLMLYFTSNLVPHPPANCPVRIQCKVWKKHFNSQGQTRTCCLNKNMMFRLVSVLFEDWRIIGFIMVLNHWLVIWHHNAGLVYAFKWQSSIQDAMAAICRSTGQWYGYFEILT